MAPKKHSKREDYASIPATDSDSPNSPPMENELNPHMRTRSPHPQFQTSTQDLLPSTPPPPASPTHFRPRAVSPYLVMGSEPTTPPRQVLFQSDIPMVAVSTPAEEPLASGTPIDVAYELGNEYFSPDLLSKRKVGPFDKENLDRFWTKCRQHWVQSILLLVLVVLCCIFIVMGLVKTSDHANIDSKPHITLMDVIENKYAPTLEAISWAHGGKDGEHSYYDGIQNGIVIQHILDINSTTMLVSKPEFSDQNGHVHTIQHPYVISPDRQFVLFTENRVQQWRHSSSAVYVVYDIARHRGYLLGNGVPLALAQWSPVGHHLAVVRDNDVYLVTLDATETWQEHRLSFDGAAQTVIHGIADWVYEEEVLQKTSATYWSPKGDALAWLRFNDSAVPIYKLSHFYNQSTLMEDQYPHVEEYRYPKPGFPNPSVSVFLHRLADPFPDTSSPLSPLTLPNLYPEPIIGGLHWVGVSLIVPVLNRIQTRCAYVLFQMGSNPPTGHVVREDVMENGWLEPNPVIVPVSIDGAASYLTLAPVDDFIHLVWYPSPQSNTANIVTRGPWEVTRICGFHAPTRTVYYLSTLNGTSTRTLCKVVLDPDPGSNPRKDPAAFQGSPVHPDLPVGMYNGQCSPDAETYVLTYLGPDVPWQRVYATTAARAPRVLAENKALAASLARVEVPTVRFTTFPGADGRALSAKVYSPATFSPARTYPVLMRVYNGPNSQLVQQSFDISLHTYLASARNMVVVVVDARGTAFRGQAFRFAVYKRLGELERDDQLAVAQHLQTLPWVDPARIGVWGWSYGGYLTCRMVEQGRALAYAIAVAPVTDWRFYDSVYTERYMQRPIDNPAGYAASAVNNMTGFMHTRFLLVHGTSDDNVHVLNSLSLLRKLQGASVHSYQVQFFPESSHSIRFQNAFKELMELLDHFIGHAVFGEETYLEKYVKPGRVKKT